MKDRVFLKPAMGRGGKPLLVRMPNARPPRHLREDGEFVNLDSYWHRRLLRRDVYHASEPAPETKPAVMPAKAAKKPVDAPKATKVGKGPVKAKSPASKASTPSKKKTTRPAAKTE